MNGITCEGCVVFGRGLCSDARQLCADLRGDGWCQKMVFERNLAGAIRLMEVEGDGERKL